MVELEYKGVRLWFACGPPAAGCSGFLPLSKTSTSGIKGPFWECVSEWCVSCDRHTPFMVQGGCRSGDSRDRPQLSQTPWGGVNTFSPCLPGVLFQTLQVPPPVQGHGELSWGVNMSSDFPTSQPILNCKHRKIWTPPFCAKAATVSLATVHVCLSRLNLTLHDQNGTFSGYLSTIKRTTSSVIVVCSVFPDVYHMFRLKSLL